MQLPFTDNVDPITSGSTMIATTTVEPAVAITDEIATSPEDNALSEAVIVTVPIAAKTNELVRGSNDTLPVHDTTALPTSASPTISSTPEIVSSATLNSRDDTTTNEYQLKAMDWWDPLIEQTRHVRIITQNGKWCWSYLCAYPLTDNARIENGPCPLLAICNILILRGELIILPSDRPTVTAEHLIALLGDKLLETSMLSSNVSHYYIDTCNVRCLTL
jgi:hypothetical protein